MAPTRGLVSPVTGFRTFSICALAHPPAAPAPAALAPDAAPPDPAPLCFFYISLQTYIDNFNLLTKMFLKTIFIN